MGELRLPGLGAGAARPALRPGAGDGVGDRGEAGTRAVADAGRGAAVSGLEDRRLRHFCWYFTYYPKRAANCRKSEEKRERA